MALRVLKSRHLVGDSILRYCMFSIKILSVRNSSAFSPERAIAWFPSAHFCTGGQVLSEAFCPLYT